MLIQHFIRAMENLIGRLHGPLTFRLILQPIIAAGLACRDGLKDAREGKAAYFWALLNVPAHRADLLQQGWKAIMKVFIVAIVIDVVYQWKVVRWFYPGEALVVAIVLAGIPYILIRGPVNLIKRGFSQRRST